MIRKMHEHWKSHTALTDFAVIDVLACRGHFPNCAILDGLCFKCFSYALSDCKLLMEGIALLLLLTYTS